MERHPPSNLPTIGTQFKAKRQVPFDGEMSSSWNKLLFTSKRHRNIKILMDIPPHHCIGGCSSMLSHAQSSSELHHAAPSTAPPLGAHTCTWTNSLHHRARSLAVLGDDSRNVLFATSWGEVGLEVGNPRQLGIKTSLGSYDKQTN